VCNQIAGAQGGGPVATAILPIEHGKAAYGYTCQLRSLELYRPSEGNVVLRTATGSHC